jgi:hypothetical protein
MECVGFPHVRNFGAEELEQAPMMKTALPSPSGNLTGRRICRHGVSSMWTKAIRVPGGVVPPGSRITLRQLFAFWIKLHHALLGD